MTKYEKNLIMICKEYRSLAEEQWITETDASEAIVEVVVCLDAAEVAAEVKLCLFGIH